MQQAAKLSHTFIVNSADAGARLDRYLAVQVGELSRTRIQELIAEGRVRVNGRAAKSKQRVAAGDAVEMESAPRPPLAATAEEIPLEILYEDQDVVVVNKPAGMVVHAGAGRHSGTLVNALLGRYGKLSSVGGAERPGIVHRLDKDTSGAVVVARNDAAHRALARQFEARTVRKTYVTLVHGELTKDGGMIELLIARDARRRTRMSARSRTGRAAETRWRVLLRMPGFTLVEADLRTGRTHQIRVHLSALGHPVAGDTLYGAPKQTALKRRAGVRGKTAPPLPPALGRNFLHAARIGFEHPRHSGRRVEVRAPLPPELVTYGLQLAAALGVERSRFDAAVRAFL